MLSFYVEALTAGPADELLDHGEQVVDRANEASESDQVSPAAILRSRSAGTGGNGWRRARVLEDWLAAGGAQFIQLRIGALVLGGHPGVANQAAGLTVLRGCGSTRNRERPSESFYKFMRYR
jgi:hypothetical protein